MTINIKIIRFNFILLLFQLSLLISQTPTELKNFMETYNKIKTKQEANDAVRSDLVNNNKNIYETDVKILITPNEISKYYNDKVQSIRNELSKLNDLLILSDSISELKDYGYSFFSLRDSISYIDNRILDDDYVLGYNDEIIFSVWGQVQQYEKKKIERDGTIYVENVGLLYLGGKTLKESKQYVFNRFSKVYSTLLSKPQLSFIDISLGKTKNINVGVSGHVRFPGNYVVNPSISFTNLLILAGGVLETGTLRNIYLKRNNTVVDSLDLYPLLSGVGDFKNLKLNEGDFIIVPAKG